MPLTHKVFDGTEPAPTWAGRSKKFCQSNAAIIALDWSPFSAELGVSSVRVLQSDGLVEGVSLLPGDDIDFDGMHIAVPERPFLNIFGPQTIALVALPTS